MAKDKGVLGFVWFMVGSILALGWELINLVLP